MLLDIQIKSLLFSFVYGVIFYFLLELFNRISKKMNLFLKILLSFMFILFVSIIYFLCLLYVNNGVVHIYFLISILVGYIFVNLIFNRWFTHKKKIK